jgi:putative endonuclease
MQDLTRQDIGKLGEELVERWLIERGVKILQRRWRWRRGEIDTIAIEGDTLLFVEVKTRSSENWDADGLLAITPQKQQKLVQTAELFLLKYPHLVELSCRFDVAIVHYQRSAKISFPQPLYSRVDPDRGDRFSLVDYLAGAFELE